MTFQKGKKRAENVFALFFLPLKRGHWWNFETVNKPEIVACSKALWLVIEACSLAQPPNACLAEGSTISSGKSWVIPCCESSKPFFFSSLNREYLPRCNNLWPRLQHNVIPFWEGPWKSPCYRECLIALLSVIDSYFAIISNTVCLKQAPFFFLIKKIGISYVGSFLKF